MKYRILIMLFWGFVSGKEIQAQNLAWSKTINFMNKHTFQAFYRKSMIKSLIQS